MMPYDDMHQMAEDQYAEVEDQLLKEVPIVSGAQGHDNGERKIPQ